MWSSLLPALCVIGTEYRMASDTDLLNWANKHYFCPHSAANIRCLGSIMKIALTLLTPCCRDSQESTGVPLHSLKIIWGTGCFGMTRYPSSKLSYNLSLLSETKPWQSACVLVPLRYQLHFSIHSCCAFSTPSKGYRLLLKGFSPS